MRSGLATATFGRLPVGSGLARLALVAHLLGGCGAYQLGEAGDGANEATNACETAADCGASGTCAGGRCVAAAVDYDEILLEITVPATPSAGSYAGVRLFRTITGLTSAAGRFDLDVPRLSNVTVTLSTPPCQTAELTPVARVGGACPVGSSPPSGRGICSYDFGQAPLAVTFTPAARALGIATEIYSATSECSGGDCAVGVVSAQLPPGDYDVYLRVDPSVTDLSDGICEVIPEVTTVNVPDHAELTVAYSLGEPELLPAEVQWDTTVGDAGRLVGWSVDMVDGASARRISNRVELGAPVVEVGLERYLATLEFLATPASANEATELVRLVPPAEVVAPTIVAQRSSLGLLGGPAVLDQLTALPAPVEVEGQLLALIDQGGTQQPVPVGGTVTLIATALDGLPSGTLATFQRTVTAVEKGDDRGVFHATLLPGKYRVRALPSSLCPEVAPCADGAPVCDCPLGATEVDDWIVAASPAVQAGKTVELAWRTSVTGKALTAGGQPVAGAPIQATAVPTQPTALATALGLETFVPRASTATVGDDGTFELRADGGDFDVTIRPETFTGFAWLVRPGVPIDLAEPNLHLGTLAMPLPVPFAGQVRVPIDPALGGLSYATLPGAVLRAYLAVAGGSVVQVAETTAGAAGEFELLLPQHLDGVR